VRGNGTIDLRRMETGVPIEQRKHLTKTGRFVKSSTDHVLPV
jgi:hypothetical protein